MGKKAKAVKILGGLGCKKCGKTMQRFEHPNGWRPRKEQPYYFRYWDNCRCGVIQHYESAKVVIEPFIDPLDAEYHAVVGGNE